MVSIIYKKYGLKINAIWFCNDEDILISQSKADLVFLHGADNNTFKSGIVNLQHTLITDLQDVSEDIFKQINKNYRYEINRSKKENVRCMVFEAAQLKKDIKIIENFKREYDDFTKLKGIDNTYNESAMEKYIENGNLMLTKAFQDKEDYAQHVYVCDGINARLLYSVSNFRSEGIDRNLIGRANKHLHWNDIEYLKGNGYKVLDWGGVSNIVDPNGIDLFKKGFGGQEKEYYNIIIGKSLLGKLAVLAKKVKRG